MIKKNLKKDADKGYRWLFKPISWRVYDGDTLLDLVLDLGFGIRIKIKSRLKGINAPEVRGSEREKGLKTTYYLRSMGATNIEKSTISDDSLNAISIAASQPSACSVTDPECEACQ